MLENAAVYHKSLHSTHLHAGTLHLLNELLTDGVGKSDLPEEQVVERVDLVSTQEIK